MVVMRYGDGDASLAEFAQPKRKEEIVMPSCGDEGGLTEFAN